MIDFLQPHPIIGHFGIVQLYAHGLFFALGAELAALLLSRWMAKVAPEIDSWRLSLEVFLAGLLGARLSYFLIYPDRYHSAADFLAIWQGGLVSFGGILAGLLLLLYRLRSLSRNQRWQVLDLFSLAVLFAWSVGRIGNYYAADSMGIESTTWSLTYGRVPIQLFESMLALGLGLSGYWLWKKERFYPGWYTLYALLSYFSGRLIIDFWREEEQILGLGNSQWASLLSLGIIGLGVFFYRRQKHFK